MRNNLRLQFLEHVGQTSPDPLLIEVDHAKGSFYYTPEGKRYYDLVAGVSVNNVGHGNPTVIAAVQKQVADYMHIMVYGEMVEAPQVQYATKIASLLPYPLNSLYFVNSGSEAVEGALKLAKRYTGKHKMMSMHNAYHGSNHGSLSMMGSPEGDTWKKPFQPLLPHVEYLYFNDFEDIKKIDSETACVLVEPVQGEGGIRLPKEGYLQALRDRCNETGTLLIFDEIQTGLGRTGTMFAMQKYHVTPDIVCLAKAFGGGMPLGAFAASNDIMNTLQTNPTLGHITTFGGHPVCCAAGLAALNYLIDNKIVEDVEAKGQRYETLLAHQPNVLEIRRSGLLMAVELGSSDKLFKIMALFKDAGIMSDWFLFCDTAFRISPPLTISNDEIDDSAAIIINCLNKI